MNFCFHGAPLEKRRASGGKSDSNFTLSKMWKRRVCELVSTERSSWTPKTAVSKRAKLSYEAPRYSIVIMVGGIAVAIHSFLAPFSPFCHGRDGCGDSTPNSCCERGRNRDCNGSSDAAGCNTNTRENNMLATTVRANGIWQTGKQQGRRNRNSDAADDECPIMITVSTMPTTWLHVLKHQTRWHCCPRSIHLLHGPLKSQASIKHHPTDQTTSSSSSAAAAWAPKNNVSATKTKGVALILILKLEGARSKQTLPEYYPILYSCGQLAEYYIRIFTVCRILYSDIFGYILEYIPY